MIDIPALAAIAQMSEPQLISVYARLANMLDDGNDTAEEQAQLRLALQRIMEALRIKRALRRAPAPR